MCFEKTNFTKMMKKNFLPYAFMLLATCSNLPQFVHASSIKESSKLENVDTNSLDDNKFNDVTGSTTVTDADDVAEDVVNQAPNTTQPKKPAVQFNEIKHPSHNDQKNHKNEQHTLHIQITTPKGSYGDKVASAFMDEVKKSSGNKLNFEVHYGAALGGKIEDMWDQLEEGGLANIIWVSAPYCHKLKSMEPIGDAGMIASSAVDLNKALVKYYKTIKDADEFKNVKVLMVHGEAGTTLHFKDADKYHNFKDFKGATIRTSSKMMNSLFVNQFGMNPMFLTAKDLYEKLRYHGMPAAMAPYELLKTMHADEFLTEHLVMPMYSTTFVLAMNKDSYNKLSPDLKQAIDSVAMNAKFGTKLGKMVDQAETDAMCALRMAEHNFYTLDQEGNFIKMNLPKLDQAKVNEYKAQKIKADAGDKKAYKKSEALKNEFLAEILTERQKQIKMILSNSSPLTSDFNGATVRLEHHTNLRNLLNYDVEAR